MDVQAILDASDSSSEDDTQTETESERFQLEQILMEDDDGELGTIEHRIDNTSISMSTISTLGNQTHSKKPTSPRYISSAKSTFDSNGMWYGSPAEDATHDSYRSASHNPEDWAVLEKILGEDDDDEDDEVVVDDDFESWANADLVKKSFDVPAVDVDAILHSITSDEDEDESGKLYLTSPLSEQTAIQEESFISRGTSPLDTTTGINNTASMGMHAETTTPKSAIGSPKNFENSMASIDMPQKSLTDGESSFSFAFPRARADKIEAAVSKDLPTPELVGDEATTAAAIAWAEAYERKLLRPGNREIVSPLTLKRRLKPQIELGSMMQKKQGATNTTKDLARSPLQSSYQQTQKFDFSGLMETRTMPSLSSKLVENSRQKLAESGLPTALAVNSKFIAVGTQRGLIMAFDLFEVQRQLLGGPNTDAVSGAPDTGGGEFQSKYGAVSSIDISSNGEALVAGYTSGALVLWDIIKGVILRSVTDTHPSPISTVRFLSEKDLKVVSVDAGGLVNKMTFSRNILWSAYSVETECLLDGTAGQILAMNVLPSRNSRSVKNPQDATEVVYSPFIRKLVLIALSSERSSFVVAVEPNINVLFRWAKPSSDESAAIEANNLPCLSWGWALVGGGGKIVSPVLARAWGCRVQLLKSNILPSTNETTDKAQWPSFSEHDEFGVASPVVALEWLSERALVHLTMTNEFVVVDTVMMTIMERLDFSGLRLVYAEFALNRTAGKDSDQDANNRNKAGLICTTFQNSIRASDHRLLVLCHEEVKSVSILGARRRISVLEEDGEWLEALALALDHYECTIKCHEDPKGDNGIRKQGPHDHVQSPRSEDEEWMAKLLIRYFNLAVENAPNADRDFPISRAGSNTHPKLDLSQSHFQMLAGVCIEFCVVVRRLDLLFGTIFHRFQSVGYTSVFLDVLEPYVLNDKLDYVAPEAMAELVEHCKASNGIATVERCLLHMDVTAMDFDSMISLLRRNEMYSALFHLFAHGLDDFVTPLEIVLERLFDAADEDGRVGKRRRDGVPRSRLERFGYKAIIYLRHCFEGKSFPQGTELQPEGKSLLVRLQLMQFLYQEDYTPSGNFTQPATRGLEKEQKGHRSLNFPYMHMLLMVDARAVLNTVSLALDAPDSTFPASGSGFEAIGGWEVEVGAETKESSERSLSNQQHDASSPPQGPDRQQVISMLSTIFLDEQEVSMGRLGRSKPAIDAFLDFMAKYLVKNTVRANKTVVFMILSRMAERFRTATGSETRYLAQRDILELLTALPRNAYDPDTVLSLVEDAGIHRAALLLHQQGASVWHEGTDTVDRRSEHFKSAIDCFLGDEDPDFRLEVFDYVRKECTGVDADDVSSNALSNALLAKLADLVVLDALRSAQLVAELYIDDLDNIVTTLGIYDRGSAQFSFLHAIISGSLAKVDVVAAAVLSANLSMNHHQIYLSLMARLHPDMVYQYLSTHDNYRAEECLKLCQQCGIADACAYLLEKMGNVASALQLILQTLESRMMGLKRTIRGIRTDVLVGTSSRAFVSDWRKGTFSIVEFQLKQGKEVEGVRRILVVALDLCERNSGEGSKQPERGSQLWFAVLDRLIGSKNFLRLAKEQEGHARIMAKILSDLLQLTMQRMVSSVPLSDLVRKVTTENSGSRLGELRETIESLLRTYGHELDVFSAAVNVMNADSKGMQSQSHNLVLKGAPVRSIMQQPISSVHATGGAIPHYYAQSRYPLELGTDSDATFGDGGQSLLSEKSSGGLASVVSRLRARRQTEDNTQKRGFSLETSTTRLAFRSLPDKRFYDSQSQRQPGFGRHMIRSLGEAQSYGSLHWISSS